MTDYTLRITVACPEQLIDAANQFALTIGESWNDHKTFQPAQYQDDSGNRYSVSSMVAVTQFPQIASASLAEQAALRFGSDHGINLTLAQQAQQALNVWAPYTDRESGELVLGQQASPTNITAVVHSDPKQVLKWLNLRTLD